MQRVQADGHARGADEATMTNLAPPASRGGEDSPTATGEHRRPIRIAVIDPYPMFRIGVVQAIARHQDLLLVAEGATAEDAQRVVRQAAPDVMLIDFSSSEPGIEQMLAIARGGGSCKVVVLTGLDDVATVSQALASGVKGYILKGISGSELIAAIRAVQTGAPYVTPELASRLLTEAKGGALVPRREAKLRDALSYREKQMLDHVTKGLTNKEIADRLGLTVGTVKHYVGHLFKKMRVRNRIEAIERLARDAGQAGHA